MSKKDLSPWPLTPFEEFMLHQDSSAYPASCFLKLKFTGQLDQHAFTKAAHTALARHPLLHATVQSERGYHWQVEENSPVIEWVAHPATTPTQIHRLDIAVTTGVKFHVHLNSDSSEVLIQFHHSCCDGIGIYQVARDLLIAYSATMTEDSSLILPSIDETLLSERQRLGEKGIPLARLVLQQAVRVPDAFNFLSRTLPPLVSGQSVDHNAASPPNFPALRAFQFDTAESVALRESLVSGTTLNDVLTRDLFLTLRDFRRTQRVGTDRDWLRLMIPTSLRQRQQYRCSATNIIGCVFLDRRGQAMHNPEEFLHGIRREMTQIKKFKLGHLFNFALSVQRYLPGGLRRAARPDRHQVSAVFTNIGRILSGGPLPRIDGKLVCGNVILQSTEVAAPIGRGVSVAVSATSYAGRLSLTLHTDPRAITAASADLLLSMLVRRIYDSAGMPQKSTKKLFPPAGTLHSLDDSVIM